MAIPQIVRTAHPEPTDAVALVQSLHRHLELRPLMKQIKVHASRLLGVESGVESLAYRRGAFRFADGDPARHSFAYDLRNAPDPRGAERSLGVITFTSRKRLKRIDIEALEDLLALCIPAIANAVKYSDAVNHLAPLARHRQDALILVALDRFGEVQTSMGSARAQTRVDDIIELMKSHLREADAVYQIDAGEIAVVLPYTQEPDALRLAEKLRILIAARGEVLATEEVFLTATLGVASTTDAQTAEDVLAHARAALFQDHSRGNQVITH